MLTHAFRDWGCRRAAFRATWANDASRRAIESLGTTFEGRLRSDRVTRDGRVTDTAPCAITDEEWPLVEAGLRQRLMS